MGRTRILAGLAADDVGESDARRPIVLLHGLTFDRTMWQPALAELDRIDPGRRSLAFDLPGHGASRSWDFYDVETVADGVHSAVEEAELDAPVIVGHSLAAVIATVYAGRFASGGVVNVDQPLQTVAFAGFLQSIADQLRGPEFPGIWEQFAASMHVELLPTSAQQLVRSTSTPRQELVLGYWREVLEQSASELAERTTAGLTALREAGLPYLIVAGSNPEPDYAQWLQKVLPKAAITVVPDSGHFPHLARPDLFAECLAATAHWPGSA